MLREVHVTALLAAAATLQGCGSQPENVAPKVAREVHLIDAGGTGQDSTPSFQVTGRGIRIDFKVSRPSSLPDVTFVVERDTGANIFERVSSNPAALSGKLSGSMRVALLPGRYRLRVETDVPWSAKIYQSQS